jgi:hypothetical protein
MNNLYGCPNVGIDCAPAAVTLRDRRVAENAGAGIPVPEARKYFSDFYHVYFFRNA